MRAFSVNTMDEDLWFTAEDICVIAKTLSQCYDDKLIEATVEARKEGQTIVLSAKGMFDPCYSLSAKGRFKQGHINEIEWH